jgi:hypothetical protein
MGSLLVIPEGEATFGRVQAFDIVDGQQRLTTFHLCFAALRDVARSWEFEDLAAKLEGLLLHGKDVSESDKKYGRYKLQPTAFDREYFRDAVDLACDEIRAKYPALFHKNGKIIKGGAPFSIAAYWYFLIRAEGFISVDETSARERLLALTDAIFQNFHFIVITLSKEDDPQVIFATLNTGGKPLAAMDLVRNDEFLRASRNHEDEESLMKKYWQTFEDVFWKAEHTQGRIRKPLMDFFLAHTLAAESGELVSLTELYVEYKKFSKRNEGQTISEELSSITRYAPLYRELIDPEESSPLYQLSRRLGKFDLSTAYPLILLIAASKAEPETKQTLYSLIGSYIIRRALCGLTAKNYNVAFLDIVSPQQWQEHWRELPSKRLAPAVGGVPADEAMANEMAERNRLIHTLANLSLLTPPANSSAGNSNFEAKKPRLLDALLRMNLDIAKEQEWGENQIRERAKVLADQAVKIWPAPPTTIPLQI